MKVNTKFIYFLVFSIATISFFFPNIHFIFSYKMQLFFTLNLLILLLILKKGNFKFNNLQKSAYFFFIFWIIYSLFTYFWAINKEFVFVTTLRYIVNFLILYIILETFDDFKDFSIVLKLFYFILIVYIIIAFWEVVTWQHLSTSGLTQRNAISFIPTGPFYNQNNFAWAITMLVPFLLFSGKYYDNIFVKITSSIMLFLIFIIFLLQGARIALMIMVVDLLIYFIFFQNFKKKLAIISFSILIILIFSVKYPQYFEFAKAYSLEEIQSFSKEDESFRLESIETRLMLVNYAIEMCLDSYLLGVGSGNFMENMNYGRTISTSGIKAAHNFIFELIATNGLFLVLLFSFFILLIAVKLIINARKMKNKNKFIVYAAGFSLLFFIPASAMPSSILEYHCHWIVLSFIYSIYIVTCDQSSN